MTPLERAVHHAEAERARIENMAPDERTAHQAHHAAGEANRVEQMAPVESAPRRVHRAVSQRERRHPAGDFTLARPDNMPTDMYLSRFEQNVAAAQALYWAKTYNWLFARWRRWDFARLPEDMDDEELEHHAALLAAIEQEALVTDADTEACMQTYYERMNPTLPACACGVCGVMSIPLVPLDGRTRDPVYTSPADIGIVQFTTVHLDDRRLAALRYTDAQKRAYDLPVPVHKENTAENRAHWTRYKLVISLMVVGGRYMHLYPQLCSNNETKLCDRCRTSLWAGKVPVPSVAAGWDLGSPERANLQPVSFAEGVCLAKVRSLSTAFNIRLRRAGHNTFTGHAINFVDHASDTCAAEMPLRCPLLMPDANFASSGVLLSVEGPRGMVHSPRLEGALRGLGALRVQPEPVCDWLRALSFLSPQYVNIVIREPADAEAQLVSQSFSWAQLARNFFFLLLHLDYPIHNLTSLRSL